MDAPDLSAARAAAVAATIDRVRGIERDQGVTRAALAAMLDALHALTAQEQLFASAEFPPPPNGEHGSKRYLLQQDPDQRFALYMLALNPGNQTRPHDHTTWAVISAVDGQELNRLYHRTDDASVPGRASLALDGQVLVEPGRGLALMPEDIHSIHTGGQVPTRHLHMYGLALERLDGRVGYDLEAGTVTPYNKAYMTPTVTG